MTIIVGLGNKGRKYQNTRHNTGFILVNELAYKKDCNWKQDKKFNAKTCKADNDLILVKPQTFMNKSGDAVSKIVNFYKTNLDNLIVVHDDVDLEFGQIKKQKGRGSAGHKGVQNIIDKLGTNEFWRVRVGIGRPDNPKIDGEDWVLQKLSKEEQKELRSETFQHFLNEINK